MSRRRRPRLGLPLVVLAVAAFGAACSNAGTDTASTSLPSASPTSSESTTAAEPTPSALTAAAGRSGGDGPGSGLPVLEILAGEVRLEVTLYDNAAARSLVEQLPVTVPMSDHGRVEKTGPLPRPLDTSGMPVGEDPGVGELGYYSPGEDLVLYYGDQGYFDGILRLGSMTGDLDALAAVDGDVEVKVTRLD